MPRESDYNPANMKGVCCCVVLFAGSAVLGAGQTAPSRAATATVPVKLAAGAPEADQVLRLLETSAAESHGVHDPALRSSLLFQTAQSFQKAAPTRVSTTLVEAFQATLDVEDSPTKMQLQMDILRLLVSVDSAKADELRPQAEPTVQSGARQQEIQKAISEKRFADAQDGLDAAAAEEHYPYAAAARLMTVLPADADMERRRVFIQAVQAFTRQEYQPLFGLQGEGLQTIIVRFWRKLPRDMVLSAIDTLLDKSRDTPGHDGISLTISSPAGAVSFDSDYEAQLLYVLPVLKALDPGRADDLLKGSADRRDMMSKFPNGFQSLDPTYRDTPQEPGETSKVAMTFRMRAGGSSSQDRAGADYAMQVDAIVKDAKKSPQQALAHAASLPLEVGNFRHPRADALEGIAAALKDADPSTAKEAVHRLLDLASLETGGVNQPQTVARAARLAIDLHDTDLAEKAIRTGIDLARKRYDADNDISDPNQALKVYWPSTAIWRIFILIEARISSASALASIEEIKDTEIQACVRAALVSQWLGAPQPAGLAIVKSKNRANFQMSLK